MIGVLVTLHSLPYTWQMGIRTAPGVVDDPLAPVSQDPDAVRDVACRLTAPGRLCTPATRPLEPPPAVSEGSSGLGGGVPLGTVLVVLLVVALLAFLVWLVLAIVRTPAVDEGGDDDELDVDLDETVEPRRVDHRRPPDTWRSAAAEHRAAGRYRDAIRCEYRALVGDLARAGFVDEVPGRTSGEERVQLAALAPSVARDFDTAADMFDDAWFGHFEAGSDDDERFSRAARSVLDTVLTGAGRRRGAGAP